MVVVLAREERLDSLVEAENLCLGTIELGLPLCAGRQGEIRAQSTLVPLDLFAKSRAAALEHSA